MKRRGFLNGAFAVSLASLLKSKANILSDSEDSDFGNDTNYILWHGNLRKDPICAVSLFKLSQFNKLLQIIVEERENFSYNSQLTYSSTDKYKVLPSEAMLIRLRDEIKFKYKLGLILNAPSKFKDLNPKKFNKKRLNKLDKLNGDLSLKTFVKSESVFGPSDYFKDEFEERFGGQLKAVNSKKEQVMQLVDLLGGSLMCEVCGIARNRVKLELRDKVKGIFSIDTVSPGLYNGNDIRIKLI